MIRGRRRAWNPIIGIQHPSQAAQAAIREGAQAEHEYVCHTVGGTECPGKDACTKAPDPELAEALEIARAAMK